MNDLLYDVENRMEKTLLLNYVHSSKEMSNFLLERGHLRFVGEHITPHQVAANIQNLVNGASSMTQGIDTTKVQRIYVGQQKIYVVPREPILDPSALCEFLLKGICPPLSRTNLTSWGTFCANDSEICLGGFDFEEELGTLVIEMRREVTLKESVQGNGNPLHARGTRPLEYHVRQPYVLAVSSKICVFPNAEIAKEVERCEGNYLRLPGFIIPREKMVEVATK